MEKASRIISWLFLPLYAPVFALLIAQYMESAQPGMFQNETLYFLPDKHKSFFTLLFIAMSVVFPCLSILYFRASGRITSLMMDNRKERILPSIFVNGSAALLFFLLMKLDPEGYLPSALYGLTLGAFITVLTCTIITFWWKISLHSAGMGILTGFLFAYFSSQAVFPFWILPTVLVASGLVMSARMYLQAHTFSQLVSGYLLGTIVVATSVLLYHHFNV